MTNLTQFINGGMLLKQQIITANGDWDRPVGLAGNTVYVTLIGGGEGCGTNTPTAGNGGEYFIRVPVDIGDDMSVPCTIGAGGIGAGTSSTSYSPGGTTSFGAFISALGGSTSAGVGTPGGGRQNNSTNPTPVQNGSDTPLGYGGKVIAYTSSTLVAGGGGGLILDTSRTVGQTTSAMSAAMGYGAGANYSAGLVRNGAPGAILIEWPEVV
ncbi:hypothetical protein JLK41_12280 [Ectopseudomonas khazarica]|uniref:hypothetical protein n=1 Tax=Ectopseudomonas khazarica TaxID=2502979 RepID=UPI001AF0010C|nr:hypothetical protein [Pseudomonas khazarica]QTS88870.1 hypothetical protein JLK41_12280 [Pseudomonas khazarica]